MPWPWSSAPPDPPPQPKTASLVDRRELLTWTADAIGARLRKGTLSVKDVVEATIQRVNEDNEDGLKLAAIIYLAPRSKLLERAKQLDKELEASKPRGPLHGIPVVIKDCFATHPDLGMDTSAGSHALTKGKPIKNAPVVDKLLAAGAIIIGKSNLSELCAFKGDCVIDGFSSVGGQTRSPYIYGDIVLDEGDLSPSSPGGSSTGSAVSISAGFALIGIGTENDGSISQPSSRQALYSLKPTRGLIDCSGAFRVSRTFDTAGAMARCPRDVAMAIATMLNDDAKSLLTDGNYESAFSDSFQNLRVGFVDPALWRFPKDLWVPSEEAKDHHDAVYLGVLQKMQSLGAFVKYPVQLPSVEELRIGQDWAPGIVNFYENAETTKDYLQDYFEMGSHVRSLADIVQYNKNHAEEEKRESDQSSLIQALEDPPPEDAYNAAFAHIHRIARDEGLDKALDRDNLDVVFAPMDSPICSLSTASGYPIANVPLGRYQLQGVASRPFGLAILTRAGGEGTLFKVMTAYEANFPRRVIPEQLLRRL